VSHGAPVEAATPGSRWLGLDALRGLAIAAMILVNNPGAWGSQYQYAPLEHAVWHGCTFTDLVFPAFLFCVGVAIVPALGKRVANGAPRRALVAGIVRRALLLVLIGLALNAFPFGWDRVCALRVPGVLQRIGVCYGIAALLFVTATPCVQRWVLLACLLGHWLVSVWVPVPGVGPSDLDAPATTLQGWLDRAVFGAHVHDDSSFPGKLYDPEGLLSTLPALATTLFGVLAGRALRDHADAGAKTAALLRLGALCMLAGAVWSWFLPCNKKLWTGSYAMWTAGIVATGLGLCVWCFEQRGFVKWARPLQVYGTNALLVFVGSGVLGRIVGSLWKVEDAGKLVPAKTWFFRHALLEPIGDAKLASLAFALLWMLGWYAVLAPLYRRRIVWRV
jgi:predicted acyltransferase